MDKDPTGDQRAAVPALTPREIVAELDRYIVGQTEAKRLVAIALRNRERRQRLPPELRDEITPKNILLIGPTGVGKTEIARRLARVMQVPFVKVEATRFTEIGYVGRDVESMVHELAEVSVASLHAERLTATRAEAETRASQHLLTYIAEQSDHRAARAVRETAHACAAGLPAAAGDRSGRALQRRLSRQRRHLARLIDQRALDDEMITIAVNAVADWVGSPVVEFTAGMSATEVQQGVQQIVETLRQPSARSTRRVPVREARRLLTQQEAHSLIDHDAVVAAALERAAQTGVIFIDEIDKIVGSGPESGPDVSGEGVQRDLLPLIEGTTVATRYGRLATDQVLFIAAGAFERSKPADLIPELRGRLPLRAELSRLSDDDLYAILTQPDNALTRQYAALLATEGVTLTFSEDGLRAIARYAAHLNQQHDDIGARRLHTVVETVLHDLAFTASEQTDTTVVIDQGYVAERLGPIVDDDDLSRFIL
jgi:ATP-dependent HslUV protease ATP-binding subunit HslU